MNVSLLDIDNNLIQLPISIASNSLVLKNFFESNPGKVYKIDYDHEILSEIIRILQDDDKVIVTDMLIELCELLQIKKINKYLNDTLNYETEIITYNQAHFIYENILLKCNNIYCHKKYLVNTEPCVIYAGEKGEQTVIKSQQDYNQFHHAYRNDLISFPGKEITLITFYIGQLV